LTKFLFCSNRGQPAARSARTSTKECWSRFAVRLSVTTKSANTARPIIDGPERWFNEGCPNKKRDPIMTPKAKHDRLHRAYAGLAGAATLNKSNEQRFRERLT
jgi:hypothetical protein